MDIQWQHKVVQLLTASDTTSMSPLALRPGDLLTTTVLEVEKGSDALLSFSQFKAYARLPQPVITGQEIRIRVEESGQGLRMFMVPEGAQPDNDPMKSAPGDEKLAIRMFEPVSDKPLLAAHLRSLLPGESLDGRITGFEKDGLKLVDFGKFKAFAKIDIPVRQGQTIALTVVRSDPDLTFAVGSRTRSAVFGHSAPWVAIELEVHPSGSALKTPAISPNHPAPPPTDATPGTHIGPAPPPTAADMALLREQIQQMLHGGILPGKDDPAPPSAPLIGALINLQQLLEPVSATGAMATLVARIRDFVESSGIYFEKRLEQVINHLQDPRAPMSPAELSVQPAVHDLMVNDIKPNILKYKQFLDIQPSAHPGADRLLLEMLKDVVQRAVLNIEQQQAMAVEKPVDPDLLQAFSHLLLLTDTRCNARLKVYYAKKGRDDDHRNPRVSLLLEMDRLGTMRTDLWMVAKDLNVTFYVQRMSVKTIIDAAHHRIGECLKETFNTVAVSVVVSEKKILEFEGEDLTSHNPRQVDLSI